jgi:hypothetical protein
MLIALALTTPGLGVHPGPSRANSDCEGRPARRFRPLRGPFGGTVSCRISSCGQAATFCSVTTRPSSHARSLRQSYLQTTVELRGLGAYIMLTI